MKMKDYDAGEPQRNESYSRKKSTLKCSSRSSYHSVNPSWPASSMPSSSPRRSPNRLRLTFCCLGHFLSAQRCSCSHRVSVGPHRRTFRVCCNTLKEVEGRRGRGNECNLEDTGAASKVEQRPTINPETHPR